MQILFEVDGSSYSKYAISSAENELALVPLEPSWLLVTVVGKGERGGLAGLVNSGNTCCMN